MPHTPPDIMSSSYGSAAMAMIPGGFLCPVSYTRAIRLMNFVDFLQAFDGADEARFRDSTGTPSQQRYRIGGATVS